MNDLISGAGSIPQEFIDNYNKREALLKELDLQKERNARIVARQNKAITKAPDKLTVHQARVANQRIAAAEQTLDAIESIETNDKGNSALLQSLLNGTLEDDMRDLEAEHNQRVQGALHTVLNKDNNKKIELMKKPAEQLTADDLDALLDATEVVEETVTEAVTPGLDSDEDPDTPDHCFINGKRVQVVGTEGLDVTVVDPVRYTKNAPTPEILERQQVIKEKVGLMPTRPQRSPGLAGSPYLPTTRAEMQQLLLALNLSSSMQMTSKETADVLKTLLTCNETQLLALSTNARLPAALKIIVKRVLQDIKNGNTETVERLWDRLFGKTGMSDTAATGQESSSINSIIPGAPISREAYMLIRETIIDKQS